MKHHVFFFFITVPFFSYSMQHQVLLLESAEHVYRRNACEVEKSCINCLNYLQKKYPSLMLPVGLRGILRTMGQSQITTEEKIIALNSLVRLKTEIKNKRKREKEKEAEDREILANFGWIDGRQDGPKKIRRIR